MKAQVEDISPIERKLTIEVEPAKVSGELDRAYTALGQQVKIPGFRPGKVPRRMLETRFREQVEGDVIRRLVEEAYNQAIGEQQVEAVSSPQITNGSLKAGTPFTFEARVQVKPKLEPTDYRGLPLKKSEVKVDEADVTQRLEQLRQRIARLEPVTTRDVAQKGDFAVVDQEATCEGKEFPGSKVEANTVELAPGELVDSKIMALEGVKVGDTKEIDYAFPPDYPVEEVKGKTAHFKLRVTGLKVQVMPELNDDFAKEVQGGQTLEELKGKIRSDLEKARKTQAETEERDVIFKELISRNAFEVPRAMVDRAVEAMLEGALRSMARSGIDPRTLNLDFVRLREQMHDRALTEVKGTLLLEAIARKEGLQAGDGDVDRKIEQLAAEAHQSAAQVRKLLKDPNQLRNLSLRIRDEKTIEFLKANATYS